ncbi:MAG: hypothetical protein KIT17_20805 [Rubrivivax sp.]|nr:hypothetical protein [Rubrivivax sp.]
MDAAKVSSGRSCWPHRVPLALPLALALLVTPAWVAAGPDAAAQRERAERAEYARRLDGSTFWRHGSVSSRFWAPGAARMELAGGSLSAGLAVGVRGPLRSTLGTRVAPAIVMETSHRSNLTLLATGSGGAMLVWQLRE